MTCVLSEIRRLRRDIARMSVLMSCSRSRSDFFTELNECLKGVTVGVYKVKVNSKASLHFKRARVIRAVSSHNADVAFRLSWYLNFQLKSRLV